MKALNNKQVTDMYIGRNKAKKKLIAMIIMVLLVVAMYMFIGVSVNNSRLFWYSMRIRFPKVIAMLITAFAIGGASIVFQSIINNQIVTPCLLGMDALYTMIHTVIYFFIGSVNLLVFNSRISFIVDLVLMGFVSTFVYSYLFKKTKYNILYVLLVGTVMTSFFSSVQSTITRIMDPNEYDKCISKFLLGVTICIAVSTAMVGPLAFLGLIVANLSRQFFKTYKNKFLMIGAALYGMIVLIGGQITVERIFSYAIPISVFITLGGGIYFLYLLLRNTSKKYLV